MLGRAWFERSIAKSGVPMVFDFDDAVFVAYKSPSNGYLSYLKFPGKTATICRLSAHVIAGNQYLADYALKENGNVTIIPTTIDTEKYIPSQRTSEAETLTIGWSGSYSTVQHLDTIRDVLQELAKTEKFKLRVIGTPAYDLPGVETEAIQWRSDSEIEDLKEDRYRPDAAAGRRLEPWKMRPESSAVYGLGIPTICSPVGVNSTIIQDNENGFLADSKEEWIKKLKLMLHGPELRRKIGMAGRKTVEDGYSAISQAPRVLQVFRSATEENARN